MRLPIVANVAIGVGLWLVLLGGTAWLASVRRGYSSPLDALAYRRWLRRMRTVEGCPTCGADSIRYVWVDVDTGQYEGQCSRCHVTGERLAGWVCIDLGYDTEWWVGDVEPVVDRYMAVRHRNTMRVVRTERRRQFATSGGAR